MQRNAATHIAVVFDTARLTFRNEFYPAYKAHRPEPPPELIPQFALIREATEALGVAQVEQAGFEADDLIAAYARVFIEQGGEVAIVSSDKDLMQLVRPGVEMLDPIKQKPIRAAEVFDKFGVTPDKVIEVQALAGDSTDNVPGVPGIGIKTAAQLINEYGDLENLLANTASIKQPKRREALELNAEQARISRRLVMLDANAPLPLPLEAMVARAPAPATLEKFLRENGFRSLLARLGLGEASAVTRQMPRQISPIGGEAPAPPPEVAGFGPYETVTTLDALHGWIEQARTAGVMAFDTETDSLDALKANLIGLSIAIAPGRACYVPLRHEGSGDLMGSGPPEQIDFDTALAALRPLLQDASVLKVLHNAKYDLEVLRRAENGAIAVVPIDDTMLISYAMHCGRYSHGMDELSREHIGHLPISFDSVTGTGRNRIPFSKVALDKATAYAAEDADVTLRLWQMLKPQLRPAQALSLYEQVERRMIGVLRDMEIAGIKVDGAELARIGEDFTEKLARYEREIHELAGRPFNVGSPKQLGEILFDEQKLPGGKRSKLTGAWGTDASVLEELAQQGHALPRRVMDWRQIAKLKSTYVDALAQRQDGEGRVHTDFAMAVTSTGRLSSSEPNLQNIPVRTEEGARIRRAFVAKEGHILLAADYSQIELRVLAHFSGDPTLQQAFASGTDIHRFVAAQVHGIHPELVTPAQRNAAKAVNFGIIYGQTAFGLSQQLGIPRGDAQRFIDGYFARFAEVKAYIASVIAQATDLGYAQTMAGRRRYIPQLHSSNRNERLQGERIALNSTIQGSAADLIKKAMLACDLLLPAGAALILQIHDELLVEADTACADEASTSLRRAMTEAWVFAVPLVAEVRRGRNWLEVS